MADVAIPKQVKALYAAYPNKKAPADARRAIEKALQKATFAELLAGVKRYAKSVKDVPKQYQKHPATWFNKECWLDEYDEPAVDWHSVMRKKHDAEREQRLAEVEKATLERHRAQQVLAQYGEREVGLAYREYLSTLTSYVAARMRMGMCTVELAKILTANGPPRTRNNA